MSSEALEQLCIARTLPWIWVIEALASYKSVDASILIHLYKNCPDISGEMGKQAPTSNIKNGGLKMSKWDVQSFIAIKRACINSFSLQKLKVAILGGRHSVLEALKERSGMAAARTQDNNNIPPNGGQTDEFVQRLEDRSKIMEAVGPRTTSNFTSTEKCDDELQKNVPERNLLPAKRNRSDVTAENLERQTYNTTTTGYCCDPERESAKKHKQVENSPRHDNVDVMVAESQNGIPVKPSELVEIVETVVHRLDKEAEVEHSEFVEAQLLTPTNPVDQDIGRNLSSHMQGQTDKIGEGHGDSEGHRLRTSIGASLAAIEAPSTVDKAIKFKDDNHASDAAEAKDHIEHDQEPGTISDSDEYHEEASDMDSKKNAFLSSQCTHSQDSLATPLKHCMKCNKGGHLLVCGSNNCPIVVHGNCLGSTANFDCEGRFYCPFCAYSRSISDYMEAKKRASMARSDLSIFIGSRLKLSERSHKSKGNQTKKNEDGQKTNVPDKHVAFSSNTNQNNCSSNLEDRSKGIQPKNNVPDNHIAFSSKTDQKNSSSNLEDGQKTKPSIPIPWSRPDSTPCIEKLVDVTHVAPVISESDTDLGQEHRSRSRHGVPLKISDGMISSDLEIGFCDGNGKGKHNRITECQKTGSELVSPADGPCEPTDSIEEESDKSAGSDHTLGPRGMPNRFSYPAIPQPRRKKLPWTSVEVEKLKEGVQIFRVDNDPTIPWKQIMEFGAGVFQRGRTTVDLKDKWRNICKGSAKMIL